MFEMNTEQVKTSINYSIQRAPDISQYLGNAVGDYYDSVVTTLLGSIKVFLDNKPLRL